VDGDSFNIEIRIFGIDAPEPGQTCKDAQGLSYPCGRIARDAMAELLGAKRCAARSRTRTQSSEGQWRSATPTAWILVRTWSTAVSPLRITTTPSSTSLTKTRPSPLSADYGGHFRDATRISRANLGRRKFGPPDTE
jgi:hypothetical protein